MSFFFFNIPPSIPKVASGNAIAPYINSSTRGARVESSYLVNTAVRKLSSGVRTVQDPIEIKTKAAQVRYFHIPLPRKSSMRKIYPKINMTQTLAPSWVLPCNK